MMMETRSSSGRISKSRLSPGLASVQDTGWGNRQYRELSGVFEIRVKNLRPVRDGLVQYVGTKQGHYRLPVAEQRAN